MNSRERIWRMFEHKSADRVPIVDVPWGATIERWRREGLPQDVSHIDYFGLDVIQTVPVDNSPRYPQKVIEETDQYRITMNAWGATARNWKHQASTPQFLDWTVKTPDDWLRTKARMKPDRDRIPWDFLKTNYPKWKAQGAYLMGHGWFGFDVTHSWFIGTERLLMAIVEQPEWCMDMFQAELDLNLTLLDMAWEAGYTFDALRWADDMGYKYNQFFSLKTYREILRPIHQKAMDWAHAHGIKACLHSCGNIRPFVPDLIEMGLDYLNPIEVKAGMDPAQLKRDYGGRLVLHGGISAPLWNDRDRMEAAVRTLVPVLKQDGGYIFATDHSVPSSVSFQDFSYIMDLVKKVGSYE
ncbi:MAG: hypothetical protein HYU36_19390 [Planctomycetes bacterium]|nr:hypothetical protein [Planctomycetota bacterium]